MKKTVLTFGLIAGGIMAAMMVLTVPFMDHAELGLVVGYSSMVLAFLLIYFGVRSYRDNESGGSISFGRAFVVGLLISVIASACYVATWEVIYYKFMPDFADKYAKSAIEAKVKAGAPAAEVEAVRKQMEEFKVKYRNPVYNVAMTFIEPFPVGLVITLVCAGILSRKRRAAGLVVGTA